MLKTADSFRALLSLTLIGMVGTLPALAQARDCCSLTSQEWYSAGSKVACERAGDVHATSMSDMSKMAAIQACTRNNMKEAQDAYGGQIPGFPGGIPGMPPGGIPGMPGTSTPVNAEPEFECCNISSGSFEGEMSEKACRQRGGNFIPDTPENLEQTNVCHAQSSGGGGGGAWHVEDFEDNIENGGLEDWADANRPRDFTTYGVNRDIVPPDFPLDIQVAFRSGDAHTGSSSVRLKNLDILPQLPPEAALAKAYAGPNAFTLPAGIMTCKEPCPTETGADLSTSAGLEVFNSLASSDVKSFVCGAYKGYISASDELVLAVSLDSGGSGFSAGLQKAFTRSSSDWVEFAIPLNAKPGTMIPETANVGINARIMERGSLVGWGKSPFTEVWLDSFHFCDPMQLIAFAPEVMTGNTTTKIPDREEESKGVQTFVNLDNDDKDRAFDMDDTDGVKGDDELVRVRMELPMNSFGKVEFGAQNVGQDIQLWDDANKTRKFEIFNKKVEVEGLLRASEDGSKFIRDVWVEALTPSASPRDRMFSFKFWNRLNNEDLTEDKVAFTAIGIESLKWEGNANSLTDRNELDEDPNWPSNADGKAVRVFPGKRFHRDRPETEPRRQVWLNVTLNVDPPHPVTLFFRSFDVDDPTAENDEVDREDSATDNREKGEFAKGKFPDGSEIFRFEMTGKEDRFEFEVPMQPGDNLKIVGSGDEDFLEELENDDTRLASFGPVHTTKIVERNILDAEDSVGKARVRQHENYVTDTLVTWRKLYVEIDTMGAVQDNEVTARIMDFRSEGNMDPLVGSTPWQKQCLLLDVNLYEELPEKSKFGRSWYENNYVRGKLTWDGTDVIIVSHTNKSNGADDEVCVGYPAGWAGPAEADKLKTVTLRDDDVKRNGEALDPPDVSEVETVFAPAYVYPVFEGIPNPRDTMPFLLHVESDELSYLSRLFLEGFDNAPYSRDPDFWMVYMLNAFQGKLDEDGDGADKGSALSGQSDNDYGVIIFQESGRETEAAYTGINAATGWRLRDVPPHEIGHLFGALHEDGGIMSYDEQKTTDFEPVTLDKIRSAEHP